MGVREDGDPVSNWVKGLTVGLIAALGALGLGAGWQICLGCFAIPAAFGLLNIMTGPIFALFLTFGAGALLWSCTPLAESLTPLIDKTKCEIAPKSR